jgi:hypothetical protein
VKEEILRRCKFCNSYNVDVINPFCTGYYYVACQQCMCTGPRSVNRDIAVSWWNNGKGEGKCSTK